MTTPSSTHAARNNAITFSFECFYYFVKAWYLPKSLKVQPISIESVVIPKYDYTHLLTLTTFGQEQPVRGIWVEPLTEIETTVGTYLVANSTVESCWDLRSVLNDNGIETDYLEEQFHVLPHSQLCEAPTPVAVAEATTAPQATIYHAPLANTFASHTTIALIMYVNAYNNGSYQNASISKTIDGYRFDSLNYSGESYNTKSYKTISGALKAVLKAINQLQAPTVDFYINPEFSNELPAKLPEVMVTAQQGEITCFTVGSKYIADNGTTYTISEVKVGYSDVWVKCYTRPEHAHNPQNYVTAYREGVQIFMIKQPCGELITTVRADRPAPTEPTPNGSSEPVAEVTAEPVAAQATSSQVKVMDIETFLAVNGASMPQNAALHRSSNKISRKVWSKMVDHYAAEARAVCDKRQELREEYQRLVDKGEMRPPTRKESLMQTASGHPDNESVQAARRLVLKHYGMQWDDHRQEFTPVETAEVTTQGEITESDVNFTDSEWEITPTPDGSNSGNTPSGHSTLKSVVSAQSQPVAPVSEMPVSDWHTIIDEIAIGDFNLIDSREWADHISESEIIFDQMIEAERDAMAIEDYEAEQAIERKNKPNTPSFEILATKQPAKAKRAGRAKFVQMTGMLFDTPKVSTTDLIARRAAQRKDLGDRMPPAPLFRGI